MFNLNAIKRDVIDFACSPYMYEWREWRTYSIFVPGISTGLQLYVTKGISERLVKCEVVKKSFELAKTDKEKEQVIEKNHTINRDVCTICARHLTGSLVQFLAAGAAHFLLSGRLKTVAALVSLIAMSQVFHIVTFAGNVRLPVIKCINPEDRTTKVNENWQIETHHSKDQFFGHYGNAFGHQIAPSFPL